MDPITVFIVDDHPLIRKGIRSALEETGIQVAAETGSCQEAEELLASAQPDVLILDLELPDGSGLDLARRIRTNGSTLPILILSAHCEGDCIREAMQVGIQGYILKDEAPDVLPLAIQDVLAGKIRLSDGVAQAVAVQGFRSSRPLYNLTAREADVLRLLAAGKLDSEIASELKVSERSIRTYLRNVFEKLGVQSRAQAVKKVLSEQIA